MNNPDDISESLETIFCVKIKFFNPSMRIRDPGWEKILIWDPGWFIPDPQHWLLTELSYIYSYHSCYDFSDVITDPHIPMFQEVYSGALHKAGYGTGTVFRNVLTVFQSKVKYTVLINYARYHTLEKFI